MGLSIVAGCLLVAQNGINTSLRRTAFPNPFMTSAVSFSVGVIVLLIAAVAYRCLSAAPKATWANLRLAPWYSYLGGPLGTCYVVAAVLLSSPLGFATFQLAATLGQLTSSLVCDAIGFLILPKRRPTLWRLLALLTMCGATAISIEGLSVQGEWYLVALYLVLAFASGTIFPLQACINGVMTQHVGSPLRAACISFVGGAVVLWIATAITSATALADWPEGQPPGPGPAGSEFWMYTGGACGAFVVSAHIFGVPIIGAARFTILFIAAQICTSLALDTVGAFGYKAVPPSPRRITGVALAICASAAFQLGPPPLRSWRRWVHGAAPARRAPDASEGAGSAQSAPDSHDVKAGSCGSNGAMGEDTTAGGAAPGRGSCNGHSRDDADGANSRCRDGSSSVPSRVPTSVENV
jgi:transporter family-2 protein